MFFIGYCAGCIGGPQLWTNSPRYFSGVVTAIVTWCLLFVTIVSYSLVCSRDNARRDAEAAQDGSQGQSAAGASGGQLLQVDETGAANVDLTDLQDRDFRYSR